MVMQDAGSLYTNSKIEKAFEEKNNNNSLTLNAQNMGKRF
jgi:hypothetical protein